jgi:hypothetical protein
MTRSQCYYGSILMLFSQKALCTPLILLWSASFLKQREKKFSGLIMKYCIVKCQTFSHLNMNRLTLNS